MGHLYIHLIQFSEEMENNGDETDIALNGRSKLLTASGCSYLYLSQGPCVHPAGDKISGTLLENFLTWGRL